MAIKHPTTMYISALILDPMVRAAFERADRDRGAPMLVPVTPKPVLTGGELAEA